MPTKSVKGTASTHKVLLDISSYTLDTRTHRPQPPRRPRPATARPPPARRPDGRSEVKPTPIASLSISHSAAGAALGGPPSGLPRAAAALPPEVSGGSGTGPCVTPHVGRGRGGAPRARCLPVHHGSGIGIGTEYRDLSGIGRIGRPSPSREPPGGRDARSGRRGSHRL